MSSSNLGFHGGGATGITLFQLDPGRVNNQEEQMREEEQEDEQEEERIQQEVKKFDRIIFILSD